MNSFYSTLQFIVILVLTFTTKWYWSYADLPLTNWDNSTIARNIPNLTMDAACIKKHYMATKLSNRNLCLHLCGCFITRVMEIPIMFALVVSRIFLLDFTGLVQYFICIRCFFSVLIFSVITPDEEIGKNS